MATTLPNHRICNFIAPEERVLRRGARRSDGKRFWRYCETSQLGEMWVTEATFARMMAEQREFRRNYTGKNIVPPDQRTLKKGDVREDGRLFWRYDPECKNGEQWVTAEVFARRKEKERNRAARFAARQKEARQKAGAYEKGDITKSGKVTLSVWHGCPSLVTPEEFIELGESLPVKPKRAHKRGDIRDDGKVFFRYKKGYKNGEMWVSKERFDELVLSEKRVTDPEKKREYNRRYAIKRRLKAAGC